MKNILVTGGAGFIGSHTTLELLKKGFNVFIIDSFINSEKETITRVKELFKNHFSKRSIDIKIFEGDMRDYRFLERIFEKAYNEGTKFDGVIHFAGLKSISDSINSPLNYWDFNVSSTINLLKLMVEYDCQKIIFSSSASIYKYHEKNLLKENAEIMTKNPYSTTKAVIENLLRNLYESNPSFWNIVNLRYFNPIGADPSGEIGERFSGNSTNIFPSILKVAAGEIEELMIFGNDWDTIDGTGVRDYIHISDLAKSHVAALEMSFEKKSQYTTLNIGTGIGTSVLQLINTFSKVNKVKIPFKFSDRRKGDIGSCVASNSLALSSMNWKPQKNIEDMCKDGWKWMLFNRSLDK